MKYSDDFPDNIQQNQFNERTKGIVNWINENANKYDWARDPNAYEMTNVFLFAGKYQQEGHEVDIDAIKQMWELRSNDFERCGISKNHFVYQICKQFCEAALSGRALVNDENAHSALRKMAEVGLFIMQQKRDKQIIAYNNFDELSKLLQDSVQLKKNYPQLCHNLKFDENLRILCELQKQNSNENSNELIDNLYLTYMEENDKNKEVDHDRKETL